jgi:uncharacterized hydrophobic protein (TIGR00271 family)
MEKPNQSFNPQEERPGIATSFRLLVQDIREWFIDFIDLKEGMDREGTVIAIKSGKLMRGANAWMLICSIMIASLGLDLNSEAVIIGAMLISPLMSPILGVGLGVSINDREMLLLAIKHFLISIFIALLTSTLYFWLTPLGTFTDMIEARTAPTFLDGLVAIFGGLAGIISITRKDKSNAIPGVAIATALMPPLCVTGYGIANGNMEIALNSFYLFFLNSFFIALTSYLIIRFLQFPYKEHPNQKESLRARIAVVVFSLVIIIPGTSILRDVIQDLQYKQNIKAFVKDQFDNDCIDYNVFNITPDSNILVVQLINRDVPDSMTNSYNTMLAGKYKLPDTYFQVIPDYRIKLGDIEKNAIGSGQLTQVKSQLEELRNHQRQEAVRDSITHLQEQLKPKLDSLQFVRLSSTLHQAEQFKVLDTLAYGQTQIIDFTQPAQAIPMFIAHWSNRPGPRTRQRQEVALTTFISNYIKTYDLQIDTFVVHSY